MNTIIKKVVRCLPFCLIIWVVTACEGNEMFDKEQYKKVVYLLSEGDLTYSVPYSLNTPNSVGYLSVCVGGTKLLEHDITVTLEKDPDVLEKYNLSNFDLDKTKYARELDPSRYTISSYTVVLKAGSEDPYVKLPIEVRPEGLSPDSIYFIPLRIVNDGSFEVNEEKSKILYRVFLENDFTSQKSPSVVFMKGTQINEGVIGSPKTMSANKTLYPLTKRKVRVNAALENSANKLTVDLINKSSLIMEIKEQTALTYDGNEYHPIDLKPYNDKYIQIELVAHEGEDGHQLSVQESNRYITVDEITRYYLSYKYRTVKIMPTEGTEPVWNPWIVVYENMKVPNETNK